MQNESRGLENKFYENFLGLKSIAAESHKMSRLAVTFKSAMRHVAVFNIQRELFVSFYKLARTSACISREMLITQLSCNQIIIAIRGIIKLSHNAIAIRVT